MGALVNGVFLLALCLSIFLEAIQRFVDPQTVSNPKLILIVGCLGFASNVLGLLLFHEHGHSHGESGHSHTNGLDGDIATAEEGHAYTEAEGDTASYHVADERGNVADVLPESAVGAWPRSSSRKVEPLESDGLQKTSLHPFSKSDEDNTTTAEPASPLSFKRSSSSNARRHPRGASGSRYSSFEDIHVRPVLPAERRHLIIEESMLEDSESLTETESDEEPNQIEVQRAREDSPLLDRRPSHTSEQRKSSTLHKHESIGRQSSQHDHDSRQVHKPAKHGGHSHGDLNMRGVFLHVMGDALGNIGVIASALIIWLTDYSWRFYSDPAISLIITVIIFCSAFPLCKAASRILLQAVPVGTSIDSIKEDIEKLGGIASCHELHVWQLSDTTHIASLHVEVEFDFKGSGSARYMKLARSIRGCLHRHGIHSSTIQPEFHLEPDQHNLEPGSRKGTKTASASGSATVIDENTPKAASKGASRSGSVGSEPSACLLACGEECGGRDQCCAPATSQPNDKDNHSHP